jgi:pyruvate/2-oxoglutarate dehydrogenase complex dihydrolipoamide dehydrogenase (E3) component
LAHRVGFVSLEDSDRFVTSATKVTIGSRRCDRRARERVSRGQIVGDQTGLLKILFHRDKLAVLGVHALGEGATELIHIGQAVLALGGTVEYFRDTVFNYPTFAEAYKVAALNGLNKL